MSYPDLAGWNLTPVYYSIIEFVRSVTSQQSERFIEPERRIAVFDLDGTVWCEKPHFPEIFFARDGLQTLLTQNPNHTQSDQIQNLLLQSERNFHSVAHDIHEIFCKLSQDLSSGELSETVGEWIESSRHSTHGCRYTDLIYLPMKALIGYLHDHQFSCYVCTGSSYEFVEPWIEKHLGIHETRVMGSALLRKGLPFNEPKLNIGIEKVRQTQNRCAFKPILAFGNSEGDLELLEWVSKENTTSMCFMVEHDSTMEFCYPLVQQVNDKLADNSNDWQKISMKNDWKFIFSEN